MSMSRVFSCVVGRGCLLWPVHFLGKTLLNSLCPASFRIPRPNLPVTPGVSWLPTFAFQSPIMKRTSFLGVSSKRSGKGNGNPLQCSCLENPRDGGAWWAALYGVAQSRTLLKQLSSSSSRWENDTMNFPFKFTYNLWWGESWFFWSWKWLFFLQ